ncbi:hypothetical protein V6N13_011441 [Hibiscus sabdariffa]
MAGPPSTWAFQQLLCPQLIIVNQTCPHASDNSLISKSDEHLNIDNESVLFIVITTIILPFCSQERKENTEEQRAGESSSLGSRRKQEN